MSGVCQNSDCETFGEFISGRNRGEAGTHPRKTCPSCGEGLEVFEAGKAIHVNTSEKMTATAIALGMFDALMVSRAPQASGQALSGLADILNDLNRAILNLRQVDFGTGDFSALFQPLASAAEFLFRACRTIDSVRGGEGSIGSEACDIVRASVEKAGGYAGQASVALRQVDYLTENREPNERVIESALQALQIARDTIDRLFRICTEIKKDVPRFIDINSGVCVEPKKEGGEQ